MSNLGQLLRQAEAERAEAERVRAQAEQTRKDAAARSRLRQVEGFFTDVREDLIEKIENKLPVKPYRLRGPLTIYSVRTGAALLEAFGAEYGDPVREFENWLAENGLRYTLQNDHDGVGVNSWVNLVIEPA